MANPAARSLRLGRGELALLATLVGFVGLLAVWPMARLVLEGVAPRGRLDLSILVRILQSPVTWRVTWHTLETSLFGTAVSLLIGGAFALCVALTDMRARAVLVFFFMLPLMIPSQITALAWISLLGPSSALLNAVGLAPAPGSPHPMYTREGIILLLGIEHAPLVFLALRAGLRAMPREMVEAARAAGASRFKVMRSIVLPLMTPALAIGGALAFVASIGNFGTPALLGIPVGYDTLTTLIYQRLAGFGPSIIAEAAALSLLIGAIACLGVLAQGWLVGRRDYRTIGAPSQSAVWRLGVFRPGVETAAWLVVVFLVALPALALVAASLVPAAGVALSPSSATFGNYIQALVIQAQTSRAFANSFLLAGLTAAILLTVAIPLGYFLAWRDRRLMRWLSFAIELPYALPGIVLAIACILVFLKPIPLIEVSIYGTLGIILVAYLARFLALSLRPVTSGFAQLDRTLDDAAAATGARFFFRLRTVIVPLLAPVAAAGAILVFLTALNELTVSALLWSAGSETLGVIVFSLAEGGDSPLAAAVSVVSSLAILALMGLASAMAKRLPEGVLPWAR